MQYNNYLGIDVSKSTIDCCLLQQGKKRFSKHSNNEQGLEELCTKLKGHVVSTDELLVCAEKTGIYSHLLLKWMQEKGYSIWLESPLAIKKSLGLF